MKKNKLYVIFVLICSLSVIFCGCGGHTINEKYRLIRIHIRADSNDAAAQEVKLKVRDGISEYLEDKLKGVEDFETAYTLLGGMLGKITDIADEILAENGFSYRSRAKLNNEFFPTRSYEDIVVESGYYDALIVELGSGRGDNWWCVIYPPLCYLEAEGSGRLSYKSYIAELFDKYFG